MTANARTAANNTDRTAGVVENLDQSIFHSLIVNLYAGRCDNGTRERTDFMSLENLCCDLKVLVTSIRASADKDFINWQAFHLFE